MADRFDRYGISDARHRSHRKTLALDCLGSIWITWLSERKEMMEKVNACPSEGNSARSADENKAYVDTAAAMVHEV